MATNQDEAGVIWAGGRVIVEMSQGGGWGVIHEPEAGGHYPVDWFESQTKAKNFGLKRAQRFGARLFVESWTLLRAGQIGD